MSELIQEMMFVNTCVKFRDNQLQNKVCRAVTPLGHVQTNVRMWFMVVLQPMTAMLEKKKE